jgi:hypothetical protein
MFITRKSLSSGIIRSIDLPVSVEQMEAYDEGGEIEKVFPNLSLQQKEFIMSGMSSDEYSEIFGVTDNSFGRTPK